MFDALLGRKFTAKCKHAIKCIYERLKPIRNRKQAVVNILKKDIADLLRNGNDSHAFGRMDGLISEMNRLACYDMIQKSCECVLVQLPLLQKQRECPPEHMEAVSTLIFAAARFSDLPELCDLRHVFTTRYGSSMETSVNPEFKDKSASKASPVAKKLQLMEDIACEFSVNWDSESFQYRITNPTASERDQTKKGDSLKDRKAMPASEKDVVLKCVVPEAKDIHVISHGPEPTRKTKKVWAEEPENVTPSPIDSSIPHVKPERNKDDYRAEDRQRRNETDWVSSRTRELLDPINQGGKVAEQLKPMDDRRAKSKVPRELNGTGSEDYDDGANVYKRASRAQGGLNPSVEDDNDMEQLKSKDEAKITSVVPPFIQREYNEMDAKESQEIVYRRSSRPKIDHKGERRQVVGQQQFEESYKPTKAPQSAKPKDIKDVIESDGRAKDNFFHERSAKPRQDADFAAPGRVAGAQKPNNERAFHMMPPPYVKQAISEVGAKGEHAKTSTQPTYDCGFAASDKSNNGGFKDMPRDELVVDDEMPKPRSVRRKQHKSPMLQEDDGTVHGDEHLSRIPHGQRRRSSRRKNVAPQDDYDEEEIAMDRLLIHYSKKGMVDQSSKHRTRTQALPADHTLHDGEAGQYQQNGRSQAHKAEAVQVTHADHNVDEGEVREHQTYERGYRTHKTAESQQALPSDHVVQDGEAVLQSYGRHRARRPELVHPPKRVVSVPPEAFSPKDMVKEPPARATSMQPESLSPPGGRMHPRLPDYDELASRFAALKKG